jgi:TPR repeat protein
MSEDNQKVPSQIFRWFEKMKSNYEQSVQGVLQRFEQYSQSQQLRIDHANQSHIDNLKQSHQINLDQQSAQIKQLSDDISYYKEQISGQQQTIAQLNSRYDEVMRCLLSDQRKDSDIKDVFSDDHIRNETSELIEDLNVSINSAIFDEHSDHSSENETKEFLQEESVTSLNQCDEDLFGQAMLKRELGEDKRAFQLFEQAAKLGHAKAMGAMGRSFFLGEGTEEDHLIGLAWLIHAANKALPQAITRVKHFQENDPQLYQNALLLTKQLYIS